MQLGLEHSVVCALVAPPPPDGVHSAKISLLGFFEARGRLFYISIGRPQQPWIFPGVILQLSARIDFSVCLKEVTSNIRPAACAQARVCVFLCTTGPFADWSSNSLQHATGFVRSLSLNASQMSPDFVPRLWVEGDLTAGQLCEQRIPVITNLGTRRRASAPWPPTPAARRARRAWTATPAAPTAYGARTPVSFRRLVPPHAPRAAVACAQRCATRVCSARASGGQAAWREAEEGLDGRTHRTSVARAPHCAHRRPRAACRTATPRLWTGAPSWTASSSLSVSLPSSSCRS